jgi:hypothetical protein
MGPPVESKERDAEIGVRACCSSGVFIGTYVVEVLVYVLFDSKWSIGFWVVCDFIYPPVLRTRLGLSLSFLLLS